LKLLDKVQFPTRVQLPLNPSIEVNGFVLEKCKYMDSKKLPLWLVFQNADRNTPPKYVILKSGDDLRQDMLTLQMLRLMEKLWKKEGLDLELTPYGCVATGDEEGMIEVVLNSDTLANITKHAGGVTAAFREDPLANWLSSHNPNSKIFSYGKK
jgi:phosphatidylinositol kinase/protein kinase (PI-3  family)